MKTKLIEALTTKFGVGAKVVEGIAEKLSKTVSTEEDVATAVEGVTFQQVLESYADKRANEASETARKNAIKSYEEKYRLKDGERLNPEPTVVPPTPNPTPTEKPQDEPQPEVKSAEPKVDDAVQNVLKQLSESNAAMLKTIASLQGEITSIKTAKTAESRQAILNKEISKLTVAQQKPYSRIALDTMTDDEFNAFIEETKSDVAAVEKDNAAAVAAAGANRPFVGNIPSNGKKASESELDAVAGMIK